MSSLALVTRIFNGEIPYINTFIDYYINYMKVDMIYFFSNDKTSWLNYIDKKFHNKINIEYCPEKYLNDKSIARNFELLDYMNRIYKIKITEDYILNVDCDEYLYLNNKSFKQFTSLYETYDEIYFNWVVYSSNIMLANDDPKDIVKNNKGIYNPVGKSLSKKDSILKIYDVDNKTMHTPLLKEGTKRINLKKNQDYYIIHLVSRSYVDLMLQAYSWHGKNELIHFLNNKITNNSFKNIPNRFRPSKFYIDYNKKFNNEYNDYKPVFLNFEFNNKFNQDNEINFLTKELKTSLNKAEINIKHNMNLNFMSNEEYSKTLEKVPFIAKNKLKQVK